jgi:hypothetical protein
MALNMINDEDGLYILPSNPTLLEIMTWRIINGSIEVEEARNIILRRTNSKRVLKPIVVPKILKMRGVA